MLLSIPFYLVYISELKIVFSRINTLRTVFPKIAKYNFVKIKITLDEQLIVPTTFQHKCHLEE